MSQSRQPPLPPIANKLTQSNSKNSLNILHWNCFSLTEERLIELSLFINDLSEELNQPDVISLNEIKLNNELANHRLKIDGYRSLVKCRKKNPLKGGGVALLIRDSIQFNLNDSFNKLFPDLEIISISIKMENNSKLDFITYYNPPEQEPKTKFFQELHSQKSSFILVGDLNCKSPTFQSRTTNKNGQILEEPKKNSMTL